MSEKNEKNYGRSLQFSVDIGTLIRQGLNDPTVKAEIIAAVKAGPTEKMTDKLGSCNIGTQDAPVWSSLFAATDRDRKAGEGGLFRRAKNSGFILLRLREQQKNMDATVGAPVVSPADLQQVINAAVKQAVAGLAPAAEAPAQAPRATGSDVLDPDIAALLDSEHLR